MQRWNQVADWLSGHARQLKWIVSRRSASDELAEELAHHIALETEQNVRRGMELAAARKKALVDFGGVQRYTEAAGSIRWTRWLTDTASDVRYAIRSLLRSRVYAVATILTLSIGIGVNTALYSLVNGIVFRMPAGVTASDRLVRVENAKPFRELSHPDFRDLKRTEHTGITLAGYSPMSVSLRNGSDAIRVRAEFVSANYFEVLGLRPARGRWFSADEDVAPSRDAVAIVSHKLWQSQLASTDTVTGVTLFINGHPFRVIGVAPPRFRGLNIEYASDVWVPYMTQPWAMPRNYDVLGERASPFVHAIGLLADGTSLETASASLNVAAKELPAAKRFSKVRPEVSALRSWIPPSFLLQIRVLLTIAATLTMLVLLVCCANIAGLQLARTLTRTRELAVRLALGASRTRVLRLLVTESLVLALIAGTTGTVMAWLFATWLKRGQSIDTVRGGAFDAIDVTPGADTVLVTIVASVSAALLFGLLPSLRVVRSGFTTAMNGAFSIGLRGSRLRTLLVGTQITMSLVLLAVTGLFTTRLQRISNTDVEFDPARIAAFWIDLQAHGYDAAKQEQFFVRLQERLAAVPGVEVVTAPTYVPFSSSAVRGQTQAVDGNDAAAHARGAKVSVVYTSVVGVGADYFEALGVRAVRGRTLNESDMRAETKFVVVSESLARRLWGNRNPIGATIIPGTHYSVGVDGKSEVPETAIVVGTVASMPLGDLTDPTTMQVFVPQTKHFLVAEQGVLIRTNQRAEAVLPSIRVVMRQLDDRLPLIGVGTLEQELDRQVGAQRSLTQLIGVFGALSSLLALIGLAGMVSANVAARRREIGVRIAVGAHPREVSFLFLRRALRVSITGVAVGALFALFAGRLISAAVWGIEPFDVGALLLASGILASAAAIAAWTGARSAASVDPIMVLRDE